MDGARERTRTVDLRMTTAFSGGGGAHESQNPDKIKIPEREGNRENR